MAHRLVVEGEALKRRFSVYVVVCRKSGEMAVYVGKTGDNRAGCNPLISRCGNHFSYNQIHSQLRNKLLGHEDYQYVFIFNHFSDYSAQTETADNVNEINEMERWVNQELQARLPTSVRHLNPFRDSGFKAQDEKSRRRSFRTPPNRERVDDIVRAVVAEIASVPVST